MKSPGLQHGKRGSALLIVLWSIAFLSLLLTGVVAVVQNNQRQSAALAQNLQARQIAENGIALAMHPDVYPNDPVLKGRSDLGGTYDVHMESEGARLNINQLLGTPAGCDALRRLFERWGLDKMQTSIVLDSLQDWVDEDSIPRINGAESDYYKKMEMGNGGNFPPNRPFQSVDEMGLVRGMDAVAAHKPDWEKYFTVWSDGALDLNDAPAESIAAICQVGLPQAEAMIIARNRIKNNPDPRAQRWTDISQPFALLGIPPNQQNALFPFVTVSSSIWRVESLATLGKRNYTVGVVIQRDSPQSSVIYRYEK